MIRTYDDKDEATFDLEGLGKYFRECLDIQEQEKQLAIAEAEAYFQGYNNAIRAIASIMGASNYRVKEEKPCI